MRDASGSHGWLRSEQGIDAFGYVIPNRVIGAALWEKLQDAQGVLLRVPARPEQVEIGADAVTFRVGDESVSARLVVAADGAHSVVRAAAGIEADVEDYDQIAIVANVAADRPHDGTAYERFTAVRAAGGVAAAGWELWGCVDVHAGPGRGSVVV